MRRSTPCIALLLVVAVAPARAVAYEAATTHPGMAGLAALDSSLHRFLRKKGLEHGLFARLTLRPSLMAKGQFEALLASLRRLPAASGARPDGVALSGVGGSKAPPRAQKEDHSGSSLGAGLPLQQWALGWLMAGSILQGIPNASDLKHFFDPSSKRGLSQGRTWRWGTASILDGRDALPTKLVGPSALSWIRDAKNPHSVQQWEEQLALAQAAKAAPAREHHLAMALMALGGLLHVLQDMGSPTHTRNDYAGGHLERLGGSALDRGSSYERYVSQHYGRAGLPRYGGKTPTFTKLAHFFSAPDGRGLADIASKSHFTPGTLPSPQAADVGVDPAALLARARKDLPYADPPLTKLDVPCSRRKTCYAAGPHGPRYAYRISGHRMHFFLDHRCLAATARHLVPLTIGYSTGLIDHLLGSVKPTPEVSAPASDPASVPASTAGTPATSQAASRPTSAPASR